MNKADINPGKTREIEAICESRDIPVLGKLPHDNVATEAMIAERSVVEYSENALASAIETAWEELERDLDILEA